MLSTSSIITAQEYVYYLVLVLVWSACFPFWKRGKKLSLWDDHTGCALDHVCACIFRRRYHRLVYNFPPWHTIQPDTINVNIKPVN